MAALKYSRQREAIKDFLITRHDHPTAETVYHNVRSVYPNISLGTVYRNLTLLSDMGEIQKLHLSDGIDHYDAVTAPHSHFLCTCCGRVLDIEVPVDNNSNLDKAAASCFEGRITGHITYFQGICPDCMHTV